MMHVGRASVGVLDQLLCGWQQADGVIIHTHANLHSFGRPAAHYVAGTVNQAFPECAVGNDKNSNHAKSLNLRYAACALLLFEFPVPDEHLLLLVKEIL